ARVGSLKLEGVHAFKEEELLADVASTPGQPYSDFNVATDRDVILALYFNEGFPEASFTSKADRVAPDASTVKAGEQGSKDTSSTPSENEKASDKKNKGHSKTTIPQAPPVNLTYRIEEG